MVIKSLSPFDSQLVVKTCLIFIYYFVTSKLFTMARAWDQVTFRIASPHLSHEVQQERHVLGPIHQGKSSGGSIEEGLFYCNTCPLEHHSSADQACPNPTGFQEGLKNLAWNQAWGSCCVVKPIILMKYVVVLFHLSSYICFLLSLWYFIFYFLIAAQSHMFEMDGHINRINK